jgi:solute carrier family 35 protein E1
MVPSSFYFSPGSEPVFAAVVGLLIPPIDVKPMLAYAMLLPIVGGVGLAW